MKVLFIATILSLALFFETTFLALPLVLIAIVLFGVVYKEAWIFPVAFGAGILLDMLSFRTVGVTSLFFVITLSLVFLYKRKFEIQSLPFVVVASFLIALAYGIFLAGGNVLLQTLITAFLAGGSFVVAAHFFRASQKSYS